MRVEVQAKRFGPVAVLKDVAFTLAPGGTLAVLGPSGVGKTTLMRIIAGLDTDFTGAVTGAAPCAVVFQEPTLLPWRSALANITLTTGASPEAARALLAEVGLEGREATFPNRLSLGQQRRLALARALAAQPDVLLLDEAFASLDEATAARMRALLQDVLSRRRLKTIFITHDIDEAAALATRVIALSGALSGAPATIAADIDLHDVAAPRAETLRQALARD